MVRVLAMRKGRICCYKYGLLLKAVASFSVCGLVFCLQYLKIGVGLPMYRVFNVYIVEHSPFCIKVSALPKKVAGALRIVFLIGNIYVHRGVGCILRSFINKNVSKKGMSTVLSKRMST